MNVPVYELRVTTHFDAGHHLKDYAGKCSRPHGHRWDIEVSLAGNCLRYNMLVDFSLVKTKLKALLDESLDHYDLNVSLREENPTAEFLAKWLYDKLDGSFGGTVTLESVAIWESPDCSVTYSEVVNGES